MDPLMRVWSGFRSLLVGMGVTGKHFLATVFGRKAVTETYPHQKPTMPDALRSVIKLRFSEEVGTHACNACRSCERACPSACIKVEGHKIEGLKTKRPNFFEVDFASCSLCGLCLDACPTSCLEYSTSYDDAGYGRSWKYDLLAEYSHLEEGFIETQRAIELKEAEEKKARRAAKSGDDAPAGEAAADGDAKPARERRRRAEDGDATDATDEPAGEPKPRRSRREKAADLAAAGSDGGAAADSQTSQLLSAAILANGNGGGAKGSEEKTKAAATPADEQDVAPDEQAAEVAP